MSRDEAHQAIAQAGFGERDTIGTADTFLDASFQITFDGNNCVEFIELANSASFSVTYNAWDIFGTPADELVIQISATTAYDEDDPELGYSYVFPELDLSLWRPTIPGDEGEPDGQYFASVGIGRPGYFAQ
jgi:hypothetical protein